MNLAEINQSFNRALSYTWSRKKLAVMSIVLACCGVLVVFCRGLALHAGGWVVMSLTFLPIFLCAGVLLATGIVLTRIYHDEVKRLPVNYWQTLTKSWEIVLGASYFSMPLVLVYLLLWMTLGIFILLREIPGIGEFMGVILAFAPFLLNLGALLLCVLNLAILFFVTPAVALHGINSFQLSQRLVERLRQDVFSNVLLCCFAVLPLLLVTSMLLGAAYLTGMTYLSPTHTLQVVLQWFFIMIPFASLLSPAVIFFFHFAAESHVLLRKKLKI